MYMLYVIYEQNIAITHIDTRSIWKETDLQDWLIFYGERKQGLEGKKSIKEILGQPGNKRY